MANVYGDISSTESDIDSDEEKNETWNMGYYKTIFGLSILIQGISPFVKRTLDDIYCELQLHKKSSDLQIMKFLLEHSRNNKLDLSETSTKECVENNWKFILVYVDPISKELCNRYGDLCCQGVVYLLINVNDFAPHLQKNDSLDILHKVTFTMSP